MKIRKNNHSTAGFTLIEVAIVVPILALTVLSLLTALTAIIRTSAMTRSQVNITYDLRSALNTIEDDVLLTSLLLPTIDSTLTGVITVSDPYKPTTNGNTWSYLGDSSSIRTLILRRYATTTNSYAPTRQAVYLNANGCGATTIYTNEALSINVIYFIKNNNLYRRILTDTSKATCSTQYQKQSCPTIESLGGSRNAICKADDEMILANVTNFNITYLTDSRYDTAYAAYTVGNSALVSTAGTIKVDITARAGVGSQAVTSSSSIRITKLNPNNNKDAP